MGDSESAAMASQFEEEEVDVMELVRRLQAARDGGGDSPSNVNTIVYDLLAVFVYFCNLYFLPI